MSDECVEYVIVEAGMSDIEAAESVMQPILLATITTVAGIMPLAITNPSWGPLGYSIVFGLLFSTVLTLFIVPMLYVRWGEVELEK